MKALFLFLSLAFCLASCLNNDQPGTPDIISADEMYFDYRISGEEGKDDVTAVLQFRYEGEEGEALRLSDPEKVEMDGAELRPDSAKLTGVFYELIKPVDDFKGQHEIVITDRKGQKHSTPFSFEPFSLVNELPESIKKQPFILTLLNFPPSPTTVHLVITDTSFQTLDVNEEMVIQNGEIHVDERMLANLAKGPVTLEIIREETRSLDPQDKERGRISISYGLRRQFELTD